MQLLLPSVLVATLTSLVASAFVVPADVAAESLSRRWTGDQKIKPRVMIVSMFTPEAEVWHENLDMPVNITSVTGLSPLYPSVRCTEDHKICNFITGEAEINAASTVMALMLSDVFDFSKTYWLVAGIAGCNPHEATTGGVAFARYSIQPALQYQIDSREMPSNWSTGYFAFGTSQPLTLQSPDHLYGTELFELNTNLMDRALDLAKTAKLNDSTTAMEYRKNFDYAPANQPPAVIQGDVACSDVYYAGTLLSESFGNYTKVLTNGTGNYVMTAQEDNATLEVMVRATLAGLMDYSRVMIMRTCSDFDRAPPTLMADALGAFEAEQGGFEPAIANLYLAGWPVVKEIAYDWGSWEGGVPTQTKDGSYYGDVLGSLRPDGVAYAKRDLNAGRRLDKRGKRHT